MLERRARSPLPRVAERLRDRVPGTVADLEQPRPRRPAAARKTVAAPMPVVRVARECDAELLEPENCRLRVARQHLDEAHVSGLVTRAPDVFGVLFRRVVLAERGLDATLRLRGVARLERTLRGYGDSRTRPLGGDCGRKAG